MLMLSHKIGSDDMISNRRTALKGILHLSCSFEQVGANTVYGLQA